LCSTWIAIVEDIQTKIADSMVRPVSKLDMPGLPLKVAALMPIKCKDQVVATPRPSPLCSNITKYHFQLLTRERYDAVVSVGKAPTLATRTDKKTKTASKCVSKKASSEEMVSMSLRHG